MSADKKDSEPILSLLKSHSFRFYLFITSLLAIVGWGLYGFYLEYVYGLGVTGDRVPNAWGLNVIDFVYFIAISMAGTIISGILRLSNASWRKPITRMAEAITVAALPVGALFPILDLGRPERALDLLIFARLQSPIVWDGIAISTYLVASLIYFYLPLIPDLAICRDSLKGASKLRQCLYEKLSLHWTAGNEEQEKRLQSAIKIMAVLIVPIAVSVHSVLSWVFAVTLRVEMHSTLFPIFFVTGAVYSGIATILIVMYAFRKLYHLEQYIELKHFLYLGYLFLATDLAMIYLTVSEYLTPAWASETQDVQYISSVVSGAYSSYFWFMIVGGFIIPALIVALPQARRIGSFVLAAVLANAGMWVERYLIVVPTLAVPELPYSPGIYVPSWEEISITAAGLAGFILLLVIISRLVPIVSLWELGETETIPPSATRTIAVGITAGSYANDSEEPRSSTRNRRELLRTGLWAAFGFTLGFASSRFDNLLPLGASSSEQVSSGAKAQLSSLGNNVPIEEAKDRALFSPLFIPTNLPEGSSFNQARITIDRAMVTLLYDNRYLKAIQFYEEPLEIAILQRQEEVIDSPPSFLPQDFERVNVNGAQAFARKPGDGEPGQIQWWSSNRRISIFANMGINELVKIASSMKVVQN